jgi:hypothetical protein
MVKKGPVARCIRGWQCNGSSYLCVGLAVTACHTLPTLQRPVPNVCAKIPVLGGTDSCYFPASLLWDAHRDCTGTTGPTTGQLHCQLVIRHHPADKFHWPTRGVVIILVSNTYRHTSQGRIIVSLIKGNSDSGLKVLRISVVPVRTLVF